MILIDLHGSISEKNTPVDQPECTYREERICRFYHIIAMAARRHHVEAPLGMAIIQAESRYDPKAVSHRGARGLMQLMPRTAKALGVVDSFEPEQNIDGGVRYFKWLLERPEGDRKLALAATSRPEKRVSPRRCAAISRYPHIPAKSLALVRSPHSPKADGRCWQSFQRRFARTG